LSKRNNSFEKRPRDYYSTPPKALIPLLPHLPKEPFTYVEPFCGNGAIVHGLSDLYPLGVCAYASDVQPDGFGEQLDFFENDPIIFRDSLGIISNPPWSVHVLHPILDYSIRHSPTSWYLFYSDWFFTKQSEKYKPHLHKFVSVGRVSWMDNGVSGYDNCAWYQFKPSVNPGYIEAY
jgi:hypothetical protein